MKIIFSLSSTYTTNNTFNKDEFRISADTLTFLPFLNRLDLPKDEIDVFYKDWKTLYSILCNKQESSYEYKFTYQNNSLFDAIIEKCKSIVSKIEECDLKSKIFQDLEYKILLHLHGNKYVWEVFLTLLSGTDDIITLKPESANYQKGILHSIPYIEKSFEEINKQLKKNSVHFEITGVLGRSSGVKSSTNNFEYTSLLPDIKSTNKLLRKAIKSLSKTSNIPKENFSKYYGLKVWLDTRLRNIINFLTISKKVIDDIQQKNLKKSEAFSSFNSYCHIWTSFLYELIKPYGEQTISTMFYNLKSDQKISGYLNEIVLFDIKSEQQYKIIKGRKMTTGLKKYFSNVSLNKMLSLISSDRTKTFHLNSESKDDSIESEYNLSFISSYFWWGYKNASVDMKAFIVETKNLIVNSFLTIWQIFNFLCGDIILAPSKTIQDWFNRIFKN